jgi:hypothetical protein
VFLVHKQEIPLVVAEKRRRFRSTSASIPPPFRDNSAFVLFVFRLIPPRSAPDSHCFLMHFSQRFVILDFIDVVHNLVVAKLLCVQLE